MADYFDPIEAARRRLVPQTTGRSFFPAVNQRLFSTPDERGSLLNDIDNSFYGGGQIQPSPTPTPTPSPRSYFPAQPSRFTFPITPQYNFGMNNFGMNGRTNQDWLKQYGWSG